MTETVQNKSYNGHKIAFSLHDAGTKNIVIFCHGFRGTSVGPSRFFVRAARQLETKGVSSLRFDQYGSGNSDGDFLGSGFLDWVATIRSIAGDYISQGYKVSIFGQGMGASAAIAAAAETPGISAVVAWTPDPKIEDFPAPPESPVEEGGQVAQALFWQEAHTARIADKLAQVRVPVYIVQCTTDECVDERSRQAIAKNAQENHTVENLEGYPHSDWTFAQSKELIDKSAAFLVKNFPPPVKAGLAKPVAEQPRAGGTAAARAEMERKLQQIMKEEGYGEEGGKGKKPSFPHQKHLWWTFASGGLWAPVWILMSMRHKSQLRKAQEEAEFLAKVPSRKK